MSEASTSSSAINGALLCIARRAESIDREKLIQTFVDVGPLITILSSHDHQIIYGRRGTGKTHALRYAGEIAKKRGDLSVYVDLRVTGSSGGLYSDTQLPVSQRATRLLVDVLTSVHESLMLIAIEGSLDLSKVGPALDHLATSLTEVQVVGEVRQETINTVERSEGGGSNLSVKVKTTPELNLSAEDNNRQRTQSEQRFSEAGVARHRVHFGSVSGALSAVIASVDPRRLIIILDEWSSLPLELQPFLADLLRRALFPLPKITVKIAAIEQRSNFKLGASTDYTGIELGADASADVDLDDYMVFDNNSERAISFFRELIFKHYSSDTSGPAFEDSHALIQAAFTQVNTFEDFVKSAEGVPRDAFNVLMIAAQRNMNEKISIATIRVAAKTWYQRDKEGAIRSDVESQRLLRWIIDEVIAHRRARAFLLQSDVRHGLVDALFDARVLHVFKRNISASEKPGIRYDAYKLDYGCYVDLLSTSRAPQFQYTDDEEVASTIIVPADDHRAIRRAILDLSQFEKAGAES